jgi:outer membrane lipoprotein-sorting protein
MKRPALLLIFLLAGCAKHAPPLPAVRWNDTPDALRILQERAAAVRTISSQGLLTLSRENGESVRFDAALVSEPPRRVRLRAWKLGRAVFDLTFTPDGLWILTPDDPSLREKVKSAGVSAGKLARTWSTLSGEFFSRADLKVTDSGTQLILTAPFDDMRVRCEVDRRALVPTRYTLADDRDVTRFTLTLADYRMHDDVPYPHRVTAVSETGNILLELSDVELNTELAERAFVPPRRAEEIASP